MRGAYVAAPQFLLDNMLHDGVAGYHVLTVLRVEGSTRKMIVNRGWVGSGSDRRTLPDVSASTERGRSRAASSGCHNRPALGEPAAPAPTTDNVTVVEYPTMEELAARLGQRYSIPAVARSRRARRLRSRLASTRRRPERNLVYAASGCCSRSARSAPPSRSRSGPRGGGRGDISP